MPNTPPPNMTDAQTQAWDDIAHGDGFTHNGAVVHGDDGCVFVATETGVTRINADGTMTDAFA